MILHPKSKVINVQAKPGLLKPIFNRKCAFFRLIFLLYKCFCKHTQFNLSYQYILLLNKVKQFSNLFKIKRNRCYPFSCDFPIRYGNGYLEGKTLSLKYQHLQLLIQILNFKWKVGTNC